MTPRDKGILPQDYEFDKGSPSWDGDLSCLWSLLDMLRFYAEKFIEVQRTITALEQLIRITGIEFRLKPETIEPFLVKIDWLLDALSDMGLRMSATSAKRIKKYLLEKSEATILYADLIDELSQRIFDELGNRFVFIISHKEERFYNPEGTIFGREIADKFPNMVEDIVEAGNCFACSRYTACVFHLMRIMEITVQRFGIKLKIKINPKDETWFKILQHVNKAITALPEKTKKEKDKKDKYAATSVHLDNVRRVWRNDVMHPKETYTAEEAEDIFGAVRLFIRDLVNIL